MTIETLHQTIVRAIKEKEDKRHAERGKVDHKGYVVKTYGLRAPVLSAVLKGFKKEILTLDRKAAFALARKLYEAETEEEVFAGNYVLQVHLDYFDAAQIKTLDTFSKHLVSWSTTDDFVADVVQPLFAHIPNEIIALCKQWNSSKHFWQRRASVVAFTREIGKTGKYTDIALALCKNLINDPADLIRKAIGWTLKDIMRGDKQKVLAYVRTLRKDGAPAVITLYAMRDLTGAEREELLQMK